MADEFEGGYFEMKRIGRLALLVGVAMVAPVGVGMIGIESAFAADEVVGIPEVNSGEGGRDVAIEGFVTAHAEEGAYLVQAAGSGGKVTLQGGSDAVLVIGSDQVPAIGAFVRVQGNVEDVDGARTVRAGAVDERDAPEGAQKPVAVTEVDGVAAGDMLTNDEVLERLRGMIVAPAGDWTVTGVDRAATRGEIAIVPGTAPLGADAGQPHAAAKIVLDDGLSVDYLSPNEDRRAPWSGEEAPHVGDRVVVTSDLVLQHLQGVEGAGDGWHLQPVAAFDGSVSANDRPYRFEGGIPQSAPTVEGGDLRVATIDLGSYFPVEGALVSPDGTRCMAVAARDGQAVAVTGEGGCHQLGAASQASFEVQRAKVHALLRGLADMDVIAVQGVANPLITPAAAGEYERLAQALTEHSGVQWGAVTAPEGVGGPWTNGFLYRTDRAEPQGQAVALEDTAFERSSTPLVQAFAPEGREAVALVSVRLSTQSQSDYAGDREANRFAGTNEPERILQIETLARLVGEATIAQRTVLLGAFGSLTGDPVLAPLAQDGRIDAVEAAGLSTSRDGDGSGSVVHVYVPDGLSASGATTWPINSRSATTSGFAYQGSLSVASVDATSPERSAAEDPVLFSLSLAPQEQQTLNPVVAAQQSGPESVADPNATESASAEPTSTAPAATSGGTGNTGTAVAPSVSSGSSGQSQQDTSTEAQSQPAPSTNTTTVVAESSETPAPAAGPAKPDSQTLTMPGGNELANTGSNSPAAMGIAIAIVVAVVLGAIITTIAGRARRT